VNPIKKIVNGIAEKAGSGPGGKGLLDGKLRPCPNSPNCVSSVADQSTKRMEPIIFSGTPEEAISRLKKLLASIDNAKIAEEDGGYIRAEFTTSLFGFIDDVEFLLDEKNRRIDFRSASRLGLSDLGTNRRRMKELKSRLEEN